jgi:hypothetical protein
MRSVCEVHQTAVWGGREAPRGMDRRRRVNPSVCLSMLGSCVLLALYVLLRVLS